jgi:hypothetical protein
VAAWLTARSLPAFNSDFLKQSSIPQEHRSAMAYWFHQLETSVMAYHVTKDDAGQPINNGIVAMPFANAVKRELFHLADQY